MDVFFLFQKHIDLLQEAFIHPLELCEARFFGFFMDLHTLFDVFWTVQQKYPLNAMIKFRIARTILTITPIGFIWKKKLIHT